MKKLLLLFAIIQVITLPSDAQQNEMLSEDIQTLQVVSNDEWLELPVIKLNSDDVVNISFDDMTHEYHRYTYKVEHCEADWTVSEGLFDSDYLDGFYNGLTIDDGQESLNMATLYTHYSLQLPNDHLRFKMSGNYRVSIIDDNDDGRVVVYAYFMVLDQHFGIGMDMFTNTDIDFNHSHQQIALKVSYNGMMITDPQSQVKAYVMQNRRWSTVRRATQPQFSNRDGMEWTHCRDLIFSGTNEYHKFEFLDIHRSSMNVDNVTYQEPDYHVWLMQDTPRPNYVYDEDADGAFYIRNTDNYNNDTESEYFLCHFTYNIAQPFRGDVYLNGQWTNDRLLPEYKMEYDEAEHQYKATIQLKMGYYSYQYLLKTPEGNVETLPSDGNFRETENRYSCLVYYRPQGGRTDLLYGYATIK